MLGYEGAHVTQRLLIIGLYATAIGFVISRLKLSALDGFMMVALYDFFGPALLGSEWLFYGVESKTFAYAFVFLALGYGFSGAYRSAALAFVAATYFHFLVGGYWAVMLLGAFWVVSGSRAQVRRSLVLYGVAVVPLGLIILQDQVSNLPTAEQAGLGLSAAYVYSIVRAPHHVAPFASADSLSQWAKGAIACGAVLVASLVALGTTGGRTARTLAGITAVSSGFLLAAFAVSYLDRESGMLGALYLFRPSSLTLALAILTVLCVAREGGMSLSGGIKLVVSVFVVVLFLGTAVPKRVRDYVLYRETAATARMLAQAVTARTAPGDLVLIQPVGEGGKFSSLPRLLDRPTLVNWKFMPTTQRDILHWYALEQYRRQWFEHGCVGSSDYPVKYLLLVDREQAPAYPCGETVW